MLKTNGDFNREGNASLGLVKSIRQLGIDIPNPVDDEVAIYNDIVKARQSAQVDCDNAKYRLRTVDADEFNNAREEFVTASLNLWATTQGADDVLIEAAVTRLGNAIYDATSDWEATVVERFNAAVEEHTLNEVARDLPDFGDPKSFNVLSLGRAQAGAIQSWRAAADELQPLWAAYRRLAKFHGHLLGPVESTDVSTNLFTACVLGDPVSFRAADAAAVKLASAASGGDSVRGYAAIMPFVVPALAGYGLQLSTLADAAVIRRHVQEV